MFFIYKITNPVGAIYIGQTSNIKDRLKRYRNSVCKGQVKLYNSIKKYGWGNHSFEIIEECTKDNYGEREIYWIAYYKSNFSKYKENNGLNLCDGGEGNKGCKHREETIKANSERAKARGTRHMNTKEAREKARNSLLVSMKGKFKGKDNPNYGKRWTDEMRQKASEKRKGKPGFADKKKLSEAGKKKWQNPEYREKMTKILTTAREKYCLENPEKIKNLFKCVDRVYNVKRLIECQGKKVIDTETGRIFLSISEAARYIGKDSSYLHQMLFGKRINRTSLQLYQQSPTRPI